jgi:hypothetical protein
MGRPKKRSSVQLGLLLQGAAQPVRRVSRVREKRSAVQRIVSSTLAAGEDHPCRSARQHQVYRALSRRDRTEPTPERRR